MNLNFVIDQFVTRVTGTCLYVCIISFSLLIFSIVYIFHIICKYRVRDCEYVVFVTANQAVAWKRNSKTSIK